jgi:hypothetical protein
VAAALPMPEVLPVIKTTFPSMLPFPFSNALLLHARYLRKPVPRRSSLESIL